jgi:hypothetical protein
MESIGHRRLKVKALAFLRGRGAAAVAAEVRCPICRFRIDAAGYRDGRPARRGSRRDEPRTMVVECKQSRGDFLRDQAEAPLLLAERRQLQRLASAMEDQQIKAREPDLRRSGSSLFPELEEWDFTASRSAAYRDLVRRLRRLDQRLYGQTKFCMIARYQLADELYLAAPEGMIRSHELPRGWGLLECPRRWLERETGDQGLQVSVAAPRLEPRPEHRQRLLRNIAVAASYAADQGARTGD